jgi:hypothetical protein
LVSTPDFSLQQTAEVLATQSVANNQTATSNAQIVQNFQATQTESALQVTRIAAERTDIAETQTVPVNVVPSTPTVVPSPTMTVTATGQLPFSPIELRWHRPFLVIYNPGPETIPFDVIRGLSFRDPISGQIYNGASAVADSAADALQVHRCIAVENLEDNVFVTANDVHDFFSSCDIEFDLAAHDAAQQTALVWSYGSDTFEVYYNDQLIKTCVSSSYVCTLP